MTPIEVEALINLGLKVFESIAAHKAVLDEIEKKAPEVYAEISRRHAATGVRLDAAAAP